MRPVPGPGRPGAGPAAAPGVRGPLRVWVRAAGLAVLALVAVARAGGPAHAWDLGWPRAAPGAAGPLDGRAAGTPASRGPAPPGAAEGGGNGAGRGGGGPPGGGRRRRRGRRRKASGRRAILKAEAWKGQLGHRGREREKEREKKEREDGGEQPGEGGSPDPEEWPWLSTTSNDARAGGRNWDPEEEWLLELNADLPDEIDANTRRYKGVRDRMRREHGGRLPVTFVMAIGWGGYREMWATPEDHAYKQRCVQAAFFVGVNCVPAEMVCDRKYSKPHLLVFVKSAENVLETLLEKCAAMGPQVVLAADPVDSKVWCYREHSLEGFHALIAENTLLAKLETEGSVGPHGRLAGKKWCKRRLAEDRVAVIPHHHQLAFDPSEPRRRPAGSAFTVGIQGTQQKFFFVPFSVGPADSAKRPILFSKIENKKVKGRSRIKDIVRTQRGWDMSVSWLHVATCGRGELVFDNSAAGMRCRAWLACKSAQRFTNALALGVPALGYAGYPSIQDACQGSELCLTTFEAADAKRTVLDLAADDAKYRRYRESAARLSRAYHPSQIAQRYAAMARALLAHAEDVHRSPIVDTAECRAREDWAASGEVGPTGGVRGIEEYFARRRPAGPP